MGSSMLKVKIDAFYLLTYSIKALKLWVGFEPVCQPFVGNCRKVLQIHFAVACSIGSRRNTDRLSCVQVL